MIQVPMFYMKQTKTVLLELPPPCSPLFVKPHLHLLQHFGCVTYYQLHRALCLFQQLHCLLMVLTLH